MANKEELRARLRIPHSRLDDINAVLLDPNLKVVNALLDVVAKYGTPEEINAKAEKARDLDNLLTRLAEHDCCYLDDIIWLQKQRDEGAFITEADYRRQVLGERAGQTAFKDEFAVTLEISATQYFPWLMAEARQSIEKRELMPGRYIRVRKMRESEADCGDMLALAAAMQIMGASYVETLDTKGTDGSNVHLGGADTITGYFGGVGQPNDHVLMWVDEFLYYYTTYGTRQVLNINPGTILAGYLLYKLGIQNEFKISVFVGNDNPFGALWTLLGAKLFSRDDGTSPLIGFNWSNSVNNETLELTAQFRQTLGFEQVVRFEHHITEAYRHIVRQPYNRRAELIQLADHVANISAKHEGGDPDVESTRGRSSSILDYFRPKDEIEQSNEMDALLQNYLDKHDSVNRTACALTEAGLSWIAATKLHHRK